MLAITLFTGMAASAQTTTTAVYRLSPLTLVDDRQVPADLPVVTGPVTLRIAPGQRDDLVLALPGGERCIPGVTVEAGVLKGPDNATLSIPAEEIRTVVCAYVPTGGIRRGVRGVAFDYFGYRNYRCCHCPVSQAQLAIYRKQHPELSQEAALEHFSLETLVDFNNRLSAYARTVKPDAKVMTHVYPVYLPEPLYGNRLDLDVCAQTAAWFFEPFWSEAKIKAYSGIIAKEANRYYARPHGAALIGYFKFPYAPGSAVKSGERLTREIKAILDGGCPRVHVCSLDDVLNTPEAAAVFRSFFGRPGSRNMIEK